LYCPARRRVSCPGRLVADGRDLVERNAWIVAAPAIVISLLMLSFTFIGDGLRDALDPRTR
jgi:oligopeptide transport system permease protein